MSYFQLDEITKMTSKNYESEKIGDSYKLITSGSSLNTYNYDRQLSGKNSILNKVENTSVRRVRAAVPV